MYKSIVEAHVKLISSVRRYDAYLSNDLENLCYGRRTKIEFGCSNKKEDEYERELKTLLLSLNFLIDYFSFVNR
jgi:hypothetical protein